MDCDDAMLALAQLERRTLTGAEQDQLDRHLAECDECRALRGGGEHWRWIAQLPDDAFEDPDVLVLPTVDPIVFDIGDELARGGMGRITKATDRRLGREVALKEVLEPDMRARFEREAMITARLQHPAIVPIYEAGAFLDGSAFYTMRLVSGGTLANAIQEAPSLAARLALLSHVQAVTEALAYAHSKRVIHRDLKPGNVLVGEFGETVVIDWGLAKELDVPEDETVSERVSRPSARSLTRAGAVLGTPCFMSPEQANGEDLDERADVYALGAILYNLLAGAPPYLDKYADAGSTRIVEAGRRAPPTPIAELAPDAPTDLHAIVERAMARGKRERYPTAKEMAEELRRFAAGQLIAREYTLRELVWRWIRKHRPAVVVGAIATVAVVVVAILAFINISSSRGDQREARQAAELAQVRAEEQRDRAERGVAALLEELGLSELLAGDGGRALVYLSAAYSQQRDTPALRYLLAAASHDLEPPRELGRGLAVALAGDRAITVETDRILTWDPSGIVDARPTELEVREARFDPTARYVVLQGSGQIDVRSVASGGRVWSSSRAELARIAFDRDGTLVAVYRGATVQLYELATGKLLATPTAKGELRGIAVGDPYVATCTDAGALEVWRANQRVPAPAVPCTHVAVIDRERFAIATSRFEVLIWKVGDPGYRTMSGHIAINAIGVSSDGNKIAIGDATGVVMWSGTGDALGESRDVQGGVDKLAFTRDGSVLVGAGAENRVFVWDTSSFHMRQGIEGRGAIDELALDPAGATIATVGHRDARARVWPMPRGRQVKRVDSERIAIERDVWLTANASDLSARAFATGVELRRIAIPTPDPTREAGGRPVAERVGKLASDARLATAARASDSAAISRDGKRVALGSGNTVQLWNVDGTLLFSVASTDAYALDDRGELFATASADGLIRIWDATGRLLDRLVGHHGRIVRLEFAPGGGRLIAQSNDRRATLWNVELETRTPDQLAAFVEPRTSWRLSGVHLVPR